jgi:hypothetical protein
VRGRPGRDLGRLNAAGRRALKRARGRRLTVKLAVTFTPKGGKPVTTTRSLTLVA